MTASLAGDVDRAQAAALEAPAEAWLALTGPPGTGKSVALVRRALRVAARPGGGPVLLTAPGSAGVARSARALAALAGEAPADRVVCESLGAAAFAVLRDAAALDGTTKTFEPIDDVRASHHFERVGAALFKLEWTEFVNDEIEPEITGLRAPERFSATAFRLIRRLRAALISPDDFKRLSLRGATSFYGKPPNFASPDLLMDTKPEHRDSLRASAAELERQHLREVDLVLILWKLYDSYVRELVANGCLTAVDAVYEATTLLRARSELRGRARARFAAAFVDDAQDLTAADLGLLGAIFGDGFESVTFAGDPAQSTRTFAGGGHGVKALTEAPATIAFAIVHRSSPAVERAARTALVQPELAPTGGAREGVEFYRADSVRDETSFVASEVRRLLEGGTAPESIAVIVRNLACAHAFVDALLARDVPVDVGGAASLYAFPAVGDALAALWSAVDPFRHDYLLRNLEAPWLRLSDASIAVLCGEASDPQPLLFEIEGEDAEEASSGRRWDERRNVRLGRNVTRGDVDDRLSDAARERVVAFRTARERWEGLARTLPLPALARTILGETALAALGPNARGRFDGHLLARLLEDVDAFAARCPLASLEDFLAFTEQVAKAEADLLSISPRDAAAVRVIDVETAKGETFDAVFVVDAKAGAWPRYYVPDAFLFAPSWGMIPKDNVGDARAARTAKFTYLLSRLKLREKYVAQERRAFYCAATRARRRLYVSASGRATRGVAAPELLAELERAFG